MSKQPPPKMQTITPAKRHLEPDDDDDEFIADPNPIGIVYPKRKANVGTKSGGEFLSKQAKKSSAAPTTASYPKVDSSKTTWKYQPPRVTRSSKKKSDKRFSKQFPWYTSPEMRYSSKKGVGFSSAESVPSSGDSVMNASHVPDWCPSVKKDSVCKKLDDTLKEL